jgi:lactate dehydrogenase-like 2-hydroxyacid dehydrogenase
LGIDTMKKFRKIVAVEPVGLTGKGQEDIAGFAREIIWYEDSPKDDAQMLRRIQDADAVLISYTSTLPGSVLRQCENLRYVGMCCSLYGPESANVDIRYAEKNGIVVTGIRDYGDEGVGEYVLWQLIALLHGFGMKRFEQLPLELTGFKVGIIGFGVSGQLVGRYLKAVGADVRYYSRTRKPALEDEGYAYMPLEGLLSWAKCVVTCLNKNVMLLYDRQFETLGHHKILMNTGLSPSYDLDVVRRWLEGGDNYLFADTQMALGDDTLMRYENVHCVKQSAGRSKQCFDRLTGKVLANIRSYLKNH